MDAPPERTRPREIPLQRRRVAEHDLIDEIASTAARIGEARELAPRGRAELAAARTAEEIWRATLLNGLGDHELKATTHVIRVIRQRLERDARELAQHNLPKA